MDSVEYSLQAVAGLRSNYNAPTYQPWDLRQDLSPLEPPSLHLRV